LSFFIIANKQHGISSNHFLFSFKKEFGRKIGYSGTLDPFATGLMLLGINQATKFFKFLKIDEKQYKFKIKFGVSTNTDDLEGEIIETNDKIPLISEIQKILPNFIGEIEQTPSKFSAIKINGKRAYFLARNNISFTMTKRTVVIKSIEILNLIGNEMEFLVDCSKGTYIRTLAKDIAQAAECIGCVSYLHRTATDGFFIDQLNKEQFQKISLNYFQDIYPNIIFNENDLKRLKNGVRFAINQKNGLFCAINSQKNFQGMVEVKRGIVYVLNMLI